MEEKTYKVNKDKCVGCGSCALSCPEGAELEADGKAHVISSAKLEECGGVDLCPYCAIEETGGAEDVPDEE